MAWAEVMPSARLELIERRRRVAIHALTASDKQLAEAFTQWKTEPELLPAIALAVAWRAYEVDSDLLAGSWVVLLDEDRVSYGSGDADARFDGWGASLSAIAIAALVDQSTESV